MKAKALVTSTLAVAMLATSVATLARVPDGAEMQARAKEKGVDLEEIEESE